MKQISAAIEIILICECQIHKNIFGLQMNALMKKVFPALMIKKLLLNWYHKLDQCLYSRKDSSC